MNPPKASKGESKGSPPNACHAGRQLGQRILQKVSDNEELNQGCGSKAWGKGQYPEKMS